MADSQFVFSAEVRPICELGISTVQQAEPTTWMDVSCYVHTCDLFRGRDRFNDRFQPGTASLTFSNSTGWADLVGVGAAVAAAPLRPGRPIRVGVIGPWGTSGAPATRWLWRGWVDQCSPRYDPVEHDVVDVNCVDSLAEAGSSTLLAGPFQGANELVEARIGRVLDELDWFPTKRKIGTSTTAVQGTTLGAPGIDLLGQAADSDGGVVYGDNDGDVVFRNRDWMLYDGDTPPDGIIGNVDPDSPVPPYTPGYVDPGEGYVYREEPEPFTSPTVITVCAEDGSGSLVAQGDAANLYVEDGQLRFASGGRVWDLGPFDGGCVGVITDEDGTPTRLDDPEGDGTYEPGEEGTEMPPAPLVELIAWTDQGAAQPAQASVDPGPITPGAGCVLAVLFNAIGTESVPAEGLQAAISGGGGATSVCDDFQRGDGAIGAGWVLPTGVPVTGFGEFTTPQHHNISSGRAFGPITTTSNEMAVDFRPEEVTGDHYIETTFRFLTEWISGVSSELRYYMLFDPDTWTGITVFILQNTTGFRLRFENSIDGDFPQTSYDYFHEWAGGAPHDLTMRFEATRAGVVRALIGGVPVMLGPAPDYTFDDGLPKTGTRFGIGTRAHHFFGAGIGAASPRIDSICGGGNGLTWVEVWHRDAADVGASGWVWVADVGRSDPGTFTPSITWPEGVIGAHACTVWRCNRVTDDFIAHCIDGSVLQAVTNSNPPDEVEPGKGPNSAVLESRNGTVNPPTSTADVTIAQSLADEVTPPYGAIFDDAEGVWIVPDLTTVAGLGVGGLAFGAAWTDDFERAVLGPDWSDPSSAYAIDSGAVISTLPGEFIAPPPLYRSANTTLATEDAFIEVEISGLAFGAFAGHIHLIARTGFSQVSAIFQPHLSNAGITPPGPPVPSMLCSITVPGFSGGNDTNDWVACDPFGTVTLRLESYTTGERRIYLNGAFVRSHTTTVPLPTGGTNCAIGFVSTDPAMPSPRVLSATGSGFGHCDNFDRPDGPLGDPWIVGQAWGEVEAPLVIVDAAAETGGGFVDALMYYNVAQGEAQSIEVTVEQLWQEGAADLGTGHYMILSTNVTGNGSEQMFSDFNFANDGSAGGAGEGFISMICGQMDPDGNIAVYDSVDVPRSTFPDSMVVRMETLADGMTTIALDGAVVLTHTPPAFVPGQYVAMGTSSGDHFGTIMQYVPSVRFVGSCVGVGAGDPRRTSWVAGYRPDAVASNVAWTEVNTGPSDIQSTQTALVVECGPTDDTDLVIGGKDNAFTGSIFSASRRDPVTGEIIWSFDPAEFS